MYKITPIDHISAGIGLYGIPEIKYCLEDTNVKNVIFLFLP